MEREAERIMRDMARALERSAVADEQLLALMKQEQIPVDVGPSVCANCNKVNPDVYLLEPQPGSHGPLDQFIVKVECSNCHHTILAVAVGWVTFTDISLATDWMAMRGAGHEHRNE